MIAKETIAVNLSSLALAIYKLHTDVSCHIRRSVYYIIIDYNTHTVIVLGE